MPFTASDSGRGDSFGLIELERSGNGKELCDVAECGVFVLVFTALSAGEIGDGSPKSVTCVVVIAVEVVVESGRNLPHRFVRVPVWCKEIFDHLLEVRCEDHGSEDVHAVRCQINVRICEALKLHSR